MGKQLALNNKYTQALGTSTTQIPQQQMTTPTFQADKPSLFSTVMKGVSAVTDPVGTIVNGIINYWGTSEQAKENERARKANEAMVNRALAKEEKQERQALGLGIRQMRLGEEQLEEAKEERNFNRGAQFANRFTDFLNGNENMRSGLLNLWGNK